MERSRGLMPSEAQTVPQAPSVRLKRLVEGGFGRLGPGDIVLAEHGFTDNHALFISFRHGGPP